MKNKDWLFGIGAVLVLLGAILNIMYFKYAPYVFTGGAALIFIVRVISPVPRSDFRIKRLMRIQFISSILLFVSAYFMFKGDNTWALVLFLAALFDIIVVFRFPKQQD